MSIKLIADSGATKTTWCLLENDKKKILSTQGLSPYFLKTEQIQQIVSSEVQSKLKGIEPDEIFFLWNRLYQSGK